MSKKNNNNFYALAAFLAFSSALYFYRREEEEYNNFYRYPLRTLKNWVPICLSAFLSLISVITSLILALNPGRTNFRESDFQKTLNQVNMLTPGIIAAIEEGGARLAKIALGERGEAIAEDVREGTLIFLKVKRVGDILERLYAKEFARAIENQETKEYEIRYIETLAHKADVAVTSTIELACTYLWYLADSGLLPSNFPSINEQNKLHMFALLYFLADGLENFSTNLINNFALSAEIIADNRIISSFLTKIGAANSRKYVVHEAKFIISIRKGVDDLLEKLEEMRIAAEKAIEDRIEKAKKAIKEEYQEIVEELEKFRKFANEKIAKLEQYIKYPLDILEKKAQKIQSLWRGHSVRLEKIKNEKVNSDKKLLLASSGLNEKTIENSKEHSNNPLELIEAGAKRIQKFFQSKFKKTTSNSKDQGTKEKVDSSKKDSDNIKTDKAGNSDNISIFNKDNMIDLVNIKIYESSLNLVTVKKQQEPISSKERKQYLQDKEEVEKMDALKINNETFVTFEDFSKDQIYIDKRDEIIEPIFSGDFNLFNNYGLNCY